MRLRRLEIVIIAFTLAFAFFIGGFFTGRNWNVVNIVSATPQNDMQQTSLSLTQPNVQQAPNNREPLNDTHQAADNINESDYVQAPNAETENRADVNGQQRSGDGRININLATQSELTDLPGIGNVLAARIVDYRRMHGDFTRIEDIRNVSGIGEKRYETIYDKITVG